MTKESPAQAALAKARQLVEQKAGRLGPDTFVYLADVEVRAEQAKQQELANMIAMLANPTACPYPSKDVLARIKELTNVTRSN